jgi:hypothetical protein
MMTLTKKMMIERISTDDEWLNRAVLRISSAVADNTENIGLDEHQTYNLNYWSGWIKTKRNLTGNFRDEAVKLVTTGKCAEYLWNVAVRNTTQGDNK